MDRVADTAALVVTDLQNDFCPGGSLAVPEGDRIVPVVNRLMPRFAVVVATQDWHPADHVSFASNNPGTEPFQVVERDGREQTLWPDHCVPGTWGAELHPGLDLLQVDLILRKGSDRELDSYSTFLENDRRTPTGLAGYLRERGVREVYLCGLAADVCVYYSAMDAVGLGFGVVLVEDATRGLDLPPGSLADRFEEMRAAGVSVVRSTDLAGADGRGEGGAP
ncbi:MAG: bifunctional nicotinamidase/pyrazinamidase [Spirochaetales bacterium]|nr:bifunctional nicotinamidase/pyrazinamidase [Spirochaetales bacterium]